MLERREQADAAACDFLAMYDDDRARGSVRTLQDYQLRFPGFEQRIAQEHAALGNGAGNRADGGQRRIGRYLLVRELGRGGQGTVWLAHDEGLDRQVALKVLDDGGGWLSQARRERLQREANALARLDHPGICTIYEAELDGPTPFLAMRYVAGETLAARLRRAGERAAAPDAGAAGDVLLAALPDRPARIARVLELGERIARALHTAHESGVVHRDVKPQNVMLTADDQPVLLDFGIARLEEGDALVRTRSGELLGSMAYLPPERLAGHGVAGRDVADRRGDVYALGVTLYECLTGRRPYAGATAAALIAEVAAGRMCDPCRLNRALPRDLALVLATALEPDPARRYATAANFADDLRRLRHHEPIAARPIGAGLRLRRWLRRHPVLAVAGASLVGALLVTATLLVQLIAQRRGLIAQQRGLLAWQQVLEAVSSGAHPIDALGRVLAAAPHVPAQKLDGPLIELLTRSATRIELTKGRLGSAPTGAPSFAADDRELAVPTEGGRLVHVDLATGDCARGTVLHDGATMWLRVAADGRSAVSSGHDGRVRLLDPATWTDRPLSAVVAGSNADVDRIADTDNRLPRLPVLSRDGARLLLLGYDGSLLGCALAPEGACWRVDRPGWWAQQGAFAPDGRTFVVRWQHGRLQQGAADVRVYDSGDGHELRRLDVGGQETMCSAFAPDGARFAIGGEDGVVRVFDAATWQCAFELRAGGEDLAFVYWTGFTPDGLELVALGWDGLTVWDLARRERIAHHVAASARPFHVGAFSDDGRRFAAVVRDGTVRFYDAGTWTEIGRAQWTQRYPDEVVWNHRGDRVAFQDRRGVQVAALQAIAPESRPHRDAIVSVEFAADARQVLTASRDATAAIVDLDSGVAEPVFRHPAPVRRARLSASGELVATACEDGVVRVWRRRGGAPLLALPLHAGPVVDVRFVAGDARLVSIGRDGGVRLVDAATGAPVAQPRAHGKECLSLAVDEQLGLFATGGADHRVLVHDLQGAPVADLATLAPGDAPGLEIQGNAEALAFDRARRRLVVANRRDAMLVLAIDGWQPTWVRPRTKGQQYSTHLALAPGGRFYASAHSGVGDWTFVDATTLETFDVGDNGFPTAIVAALRFSPDARLLLVASRDDTVSLWDLEQRERRLELRAQHGGLRSAEFDRTGEWVVTGSQDGTLRAWPVHPLPLAQSHWARLAGRPAGQ
jgi:WD40 repeat protein